MLTLQEHSAKSKQFNIKLKFWRKKAIKSEFDIKSSDIQATIETRFIAQLERLIMRELKNLQRKAVAEDVIISSKEMSTAKSSDAPGNSDEDPLDRMSKKKVAVDDEDADGGGDSDTDNEDAIEQIGDGDAKQDTRLQKSKYDDDDEDEAEDELSMPKSDDAAPDMTQVLDNDDEVEETPKTRKREAKENVIASHKYVSDYTFDSKSHWCNIKLEVSKFLPTTIVSCRYAENAYAIYCATGRRIYHYPPSTWN